MNNKTKKIEDLFSQARNAVAVPSYTQFSHMMHRPIHSPLSSFVTKMQAHRKAYGWMIRGVVLASVAIMVILPVIYSSQDRISLGTQIISEEANGEISLLEQEDSLIGNSVDSMLNQLLIITNN